MGKWRTGFQYWNWILLITKHPKQQQKTEGATMHTDIFSFKPTWTWSLMFIEIKCRLPDEVGRWPLGDSGLLAFGLQKIVESLMSSTFLACG